MESVVFRGVSSSFRKMNKSLLNNELVYKLADPCRLTDTSWIQPGKSAWEWWHKAVLEGVDFPCGNKQLSLQLYKYYVDWASKNHIEYMTLDAGWSEDYIKELCSYAKEKNVKIIVWTWLVVPERIQVTGSLKCTAMVYPEQRSTFSNGMTR